MNTIRNQAIVIAKFFLRSQCLGRLVGSTLLTLCPYLASGAENLPDVDACRQNLSAVFRAIQEFRRAHQRLPDRLGDLVPLLIPQADRLKCPAAPAAGQQEGSLAAAASVAAGMYLYEFEPRPLTNALAQSVGVTLRGWRQLQMGRIGSDVPLVRCTNHSSPLNLSFAGQVYPSGPDWEHRVAALVREEGLSLETLLAEHVRLEVIRIPAREPGLPRDLIDLNQYYNGSLKGWLEWSPGSNLAQLPVGRTVLGQVAFDVRGVVQLGSLQFNMLHRPTAVSNIVVGLRCHNLAFLHGTVAKEGQVTVGQYVFHFEDQSTEVFPITYGQHVLDWRAEALNPGTLDHTTRSWSGSITDTSGRNKTVHLYTTHWVNRRPEIEIRRLDYVSSMTQSSPFLVAISAGTTEAPAAKLNH